MKFEDLTKEHTEEEEKILRTYIKLNNVKDVIKGDYDILFKVNIALTEKKHCLFRWLSTLFIFITWSGLYRNIIYHTFLNRFFICLTSILSADLISGLVHVYLDHSKIRYDNTVTDFNRMGFQVHHMYPDFQWKMDKDYQPHYECNTVLPICIVVSFFNVLTFDSYFVYLFCYFIVLFQTGHYWSHAHVHNKSVPKAVRWLQDHYLLLKPSIHQKHHQSYDSNYCILNGWCNPIVNLLFKNKTLLDIYITVIDKLV